MTAATSIQSDILRAGCELGIQMDQALPLKKTRLPRLLGTLGAHQVSKPIIVPTEADEIYTRMWLARKSATQEDDSPISLVTDMVDVQTTRDTQASQIAHGRNIAATYSPIRGLDLYEDLGTPQEVTLDRIQELGGYVAQIAQAKLYSELKQAPSHPNDLGTLGF